MLMPRCLNISYCNCNFMSTALLCSYVFLFSFSVSSLLSLLATMQLNLQHSILLYSTLLYCAVLPPVLYFPSQSCPIIKYHVTSHSISSLSVLLQSTYRRSIRRFASSSTANPSCIYACQQGTSERELLTGIRVTC